MLTHKRELTIYEMGPGIPSVVKLIDQGWYRQHQRRHLYYIYTGR